MPEERRKEIIAQKNCESEGRRRPAHTCGQSVIYSLMGEALVMMRARKKMV